MNKFLQKVLLLMIFRCTVKMCNFCLTFKIFSLIWKFGNDSYLMANSLLTEEKSQNFYCYKSLFILRVSADLLLPLQNCMRFDPKLMKVCNVHLCHKNVSHASNDY